MASSMKTSGEEKDMNGGGPVVSSASDLGSPVGPMAGFFGADEEEDGDQGREQDMEQDMEEVTPVPKVDSKMALVSPTDAERDELIQRIQNRLQENWAEVIYTVGTGEGDKGGLSEGDLAISTQTLREICEKSLNAECIELRRRTEEEGTVVDFLVRVRADASDFMEVRVAVVGNVDAGKSTLLGVLTHSELDNGRGFARQKLFRHKHEMETGRTSSVGNDILGFDSLGQVVNRPDHGNLDWVRICEKSSKVVTFIDLAGHEKYLKTTVFGMTGHAPDFSMLMVGANAGVVGMTKEHLGLALALGVPVFVVVTKIDMCPPNILHDTLQMLHKILKSPGCRKIPVLVQSLDDVIVSATNFTSERMCPIFQVSNVTGENLDLLRMFLNLLGTRMPRQYSSPAEFQIDETFAVPGVGTVVSGTTLRGHIRLGDSLLLGPDLVGQFQPLIIKSIHRKRMPVREVCGGQTASFSLKKMKRSQIRKGMVLISPLLEPKACWEFESEILVLHHPTTISVKYQAMVHVGSVRQTATILTMTKEHLRTGDKALVRFRFIKNPEYLRKDTRMVFREGRTKAVGTVTQVFPHIPAAAQNYRNQSRAAGGGARKAGEGQGSKKEQGEGSVVRPQNEPQKPSNRNRRGRNSAAAWQQRHAAAGVGGGASAATSAGGGASATAASPAAGNEAKTAAAAVESGAGGKTVEASAGGKAAVAAKENGAAAGSGLENVFSR